jgi:sulfatase maturation enzyme AslB (radical SAM superfamily)
MIPEENIFPILSVQTTYKCNMRCANCYLGNMLNNSKFKDIDLEKLENVFKKLPKRTDIRFIGAEPTMNDNLFEMIKSAKKYKHRPQILTNGLKLGQEQYVIDLKRSGLNYLGLSMNGGLDDEVYKRFDNGKYAKIKTRALEYCIKHKIVPHINVIIDPTNLHILNPLINYIIQLCKKYNRRIGISFPLTIRIKSVAKMGNFLNTYSYNINELIEIMKKEFSKFTDQEIVPNFIIDGIKETNTCMVYFETEVGKISGKVTDWTIDDDGLPLAKSKRRGIITDKYEIEPFFEYYGGINETQLPRLEK